MDVASSCNKRMFTENIVPFIAVYFAFSLSNYYWFDNVFDNRFRNRIWGKWE